MNPRTFSLIYLILLCLHTDFTGTPHKFHPKSPINHPHSLRFKSRKIFDSPRSPRNFQQKFKIFDPNSEFCIQNSAEVAELGVGDALYLPASWFHEVSPRISPNQLDCVWSSSKEKSRATLSIRNVSKRVRLRWRSAGQCQWQAVKNRRKSFALRRYFRRQRGLADI